MNIAHKLIIYICAHFHNDLLFLTGVYHCLLLTVDIMKIQQVGFAN